MYIQTSSFGNFGTSCEALEASVKRTAAAATTPKLVTLYHAASAKLDDCRAQAKEHARVTSPGYIAQQQLMATTQRLVGSIGKPSAGYQSAIELASRGIRPPPRWTGGPETKSSSTGLFVGLGITTLVAIIATVLILKK